MSLPKKPFDEDDMVDEPTFPDDDLEEEVLKKKPMKYDEEDEDEEEYEVTPFERFDNYWKQVEHAFTQQPCLTFSIPVKLDTKLVTKPDALGVIKMHSGGRWRLCLGSKPVRDCSLRARMELVRYLPKLWEERKAKVTDVLKELDAANQELEQLIIQLDAEDTDEETPPEKE